MAIDTTRIRYWLLFLPGKEAHESKDDNWQIPVDRSQIRDIGHKHGAKACPKRGGSDTDVSHDGGVDLGRVDVAQAEGTRSRAATHHVKKYNRHHIIAEN